jgi:hypothetical protein
MISYYFGIESSLGGVHKRRPQLGGEGVEECVTECDSRKPVGRTKFVPRELVFV